ncbi:MAG TPA: KH domain-containing protein [Verrucomicrobiales bacterium]|nr:KH domain-containing protein [Verrucomicrobiales bacterium]
MSTIPKSILENLLNRLGFDATVEETPMDEGSLLNVNTEDDPGRLIGRQGRTLSDLQYLTNRLLIVQDKEAPKVTVDVGNYRTENREELVKKANEAAAKARRWGEVVEMEPMTAFDRRTVHQALAEAEGISTESIEVDGTANKVILVRPKK